jgi:hypothetical protein
MMHTQTFTAAKPSRPTASPLARTMRTLRDYREGKTLLARMLRSARSPQAALRAEALLEQILDFELRMDPDGIEPAFEASPDPDPVVDTMSGPQRRWSDLAA